MRINLLSILKTKLFVLLGFIFLLNNVFSQEQITIQPISDDDPNYDRIPHWYLEQQQNSEKGPSTVVTVGNYDNFDLGQDFAESHISVNPDDPDEFFAAYNTDATHRTLDGHDWDDGTAVSWGTTIRGDVLTAYDAEGRLYYENMYGSPSILGCKIVRSSNNGLTWSSPVTSIAGVDKNWLAVDQSTPGANSPYAGYVYTVMTSSSGGNFARSTNYGSSWSTTFTPSTQSLPGMMVCVGPNGSTNGGAVYVVTNGGSTTASTYTFYRSLNGGATFSFRSAQNFAGYVGTYTGPPYLRHSVENMRTRPYPFIAADNSNGPYRGRLYLVYASNYPAGSGNKPNIYCRYSTNGGLTWSSAIRVNDDASASANHQWAPAIWCDTQTGRLYIHWYDTRDDASDETAYMYATYSDNGGASFVTNHKLSNEPMTINCTTCNGGGTPRYQGDYTSIASHGGVSISAWTDFRDGEFDSYVGYFPDYAMSLTQTSKGTDGASMILANVPSVKLYTDDVTFTASMQTPGSGSFSIVYPEGNTLSSFPGSIPIKVVDNGVPAGNYTLTVVGRGPNGTPVHERQLNIYVGGPYIWTGTVSTSWTNGSNWSTGVVPTQGDDVTIPSGTPYSPVISSGYAYCYNLTIQSGATLTQNGTSYFYVHGDFDSDGGTFTQNGLSYLYFDGTTNNSWDDDGEDDTYQHVRVLKDYPHFYTFMWQDMTVNGSFEIREGEFKIDAQWTLTVNGSAANAFEVESGGKLTLNDEHIDIVDGDASFYDGSQASIIGGSISCGGDFIIHDNTSYDIQFMGGSLTMHGSGAQNLEIADAGSYLHDFITDKASGTCTLIGADLDVKNDFTINQGTFSPEATTIILGGSWTNNVGAGGFLEATSTVRFNKPTNGVQFINSTEHFNIIENDASFDGIRPVSGTDVSCNVYDWISGGVSTSNSTFTAYDLADNSLYGKFYALGGSQIILHEPSGYVDLFGDILVKNNALIQVNGGNDESYWSGAGVTNNVTVETGGVLDFVDMGIYIWDGGTLNYDIQQGSAIKVGKDFICARTDFNPAGGVLEFQGGADAIFSIATGSTLYDVLMNKSGGDKSSYTVTDRDGKSSNSSKSNAATFYSDIVVENNFDITDGTSNTSTFNLYVGGNWSNTVGPAAFVENTNTVFLDGPNNSDILTEETFYNLTVNKSNGNFQALEAFENVTVSNQIYIFDGVYEMNPGANLIVGNDVIIAAGAGLNANDAALNIYVGGNWTNYNTDYSIYHGFWHGYVSKVIFNSSDNSILTTSAPQEDFYNLTVYKSADQFRTNDNIQVFGDLLLYDGEWNDNISGLTHTFHGDFEVTNNAAWFTHVSPNTVVFAGENDQDLAYNHIGVGYFRDVIVDKSPVDNTYGNSLDPSGKPNGGNNNPKAQTLTMMTDIDIQLGGTLTIDEGTMEVDGNTLRGDGDITINGGMLSLNSNSTLWVDDGAQLSVNGGTLETIGTAGNMAHITHRNTGYYAFEVENGGTISAEYTLFEYTSSNGVWIKEDGFADPVHTFHNCTFQNGTAGSATLLVFNNNQVLTCNNVNFPQTGVSYWNVAKALDIGEVTMVGATGAFAGEDYEYDTYNRVHWTYLNRSLDLTMFIQGPYNSSTGKMDLGLNSILPINQPFDTPPLSNPSPDWYYTGTESVVSIPNAFIVDWVLVQLRDAASPAAAGPATTIYTQAAFITNTGQIVDLDGVSPLTFSGSISNNLYAVVWTRNHLGVISANPLVDVGGTFSYDFSSASGQAFGGVNAQNLLSNAPEVWGTIAGDPNATGLVAIGDKTNVWEIQAAEKGYLESDLNFDGEADNVDKNDYWLPNMGAGSSIPE